MLIFLHVSSYLLSKAPVLTPDSSEEPTLQVKPSSAPFERNTNSPSSEIERRPTRPANDPPTTKRPTPDLVSPISIVPVYVDLEDVCLVGTEESGKRQLIRESESSQTNKLGRYLQHASNLFETTGKSGKADGKSSKALLMDTYCHNPFGKYRTCFHRSNTLGACDTISSGKPYIALNEVLIAGTMHLTLLDDGGIVTCQKEFQLEKAILTFLADNIGSDSTFEPICVYAGGKNAESKQLVPGRAGQYARSTAIEVEIQYLQKKKSRRMVEEQLRIDTRELQNKCTRTERVLCCSQYAMNSFIAKHCESLGCNLNECGFGRRPITSSYNLSTSIYEKHYNQRERTGKSSSTYAKSGKSNNSKSSKTDQYYIEHNSCPWYGMLYGDKFNDVIKKYSLFNPKESRSLLDIKDTTSCAICSANRYSIEQYGTPSLPCDDFISENCVENEDLPSELELSNPQTIEPVPVPQRYPTILPASGDLPTQSSVLSSQPALPTLSPQEGSLQPQSESSPTLSPVTSSLVPSTAPSIDSISTPAPSTTMITTSPWDFESGVFPQIPWKTGGDGIWTINTEKVDSGSYSIMSPDLGSDNIAGPRTSTATLTLNSDFTGGLVKARVLAR